MDGTCKEWHFSNMALIPTFDLYGEHSAFPDLLHCETVLARAACHDWHIAPHRHVDLHQFFLLTAGRAEVTVDGRTLEMALPVLVSVPRNAVHGFLFAQGTEGIVITLPVAEFPDTFGGRLGRWCSVEADADIRAVAATLADEHRGRAFGREPMLRALVEQLAVQVARRVAVGDAPEPAASAKMLALDALVQQNLRHRWRVSDYAAALGMTPTHLTRVTHAATGLSASRYIERLLFQEARRRLAYTRASVADVGYTLGFEDASYFSRAFRRHCGRSPNAYRRQFRQGG